MKKIIYILITLVVISSSFGVLSKSVFADTFNQNDIIDDAVFDDYNSMTASQIQNFLGAFPKSCLTNYQAPYPTDYWTYGGNVPASTVIKRVADLWQINPKVILTTLEKEENLVTGNSGCDSWRYNSAVGMGCPDGGTCPDPKYAGFSQQVTKGMWQLMFSKERSYGNLSWGDNGNSRYYGFMTAGYRARQTGETPVYYDGYATIDNTSVYMSNGATAALYTYTPHFHGNQNFLTIFNQWFGSTYFPQPIGASLYYQQSSGSIYLIDNSTDTPTYYLVPNWAMMQNYGLDVYPVLPVPDSTIQAMTNGGTLTNLTWDSDGVHLVNNGVRYHVPGDMCTAWGLSCFDSTQVKALGSIFQTQYLRQGGELPGLSYINGGIYKLSAGTRQHIANLKTLSDLGLSNAPVLATSAVNSLQPLGILLLTTPGVIQFSPTSAIYYFDGVNYFKVANMNSYCDWALYNEASLGMPDSSYAQSPPPSTELTPWVLLDGKRYIVDQGRKLLIPDSLSALWQDSQFISQPGALLNNLTTASLSQLVWTNPAVYYIDAQGKHYVSSYDDYVTLNNSLGSTSNIGVDKLSTLPNGSDIIGDGRVISLDDGSGKIYVVNNHKITYIPSPDIFNSYGFNWGAIQSFPTTILSDYPIDSSSLGNSVSADNTHYILSGATLYKLSDSLAKDFGTIDTKFMSINNQIIKNNPKTLSRFLYNKDDGSIYYASGGAIHHIETLSAFKAYGGMSSPAIAMNSSTISLFTVAQPVY